MLLRAAARLAPTGISVELYRDLGTLPLFNPDLEAENPKSVAALRQRIVAADAVLIASPEYAHGVTGAIRNALDWTGGNESFVYKPVELLNASPRATIAQAALREILVTMSAHVVPAACVDVPVMGHGLDEDGIVNHAEMRSVIISALTALQSASRKSFDADA